MLAYIDDQRTPDGSGVQHFMRGPVAFDAVRGRFYMEAQASCESTNCGSCDSPGAFRIQLLLFSGFPHPHRRP